MNTYEVLYGTINGQKVGQTVELSKEEATALGSDYVKLVKGGKSDELKAIDKLKRDELVALCGTLEIEVDEKDTVAILLEKVSKNESENNPYNNKQIK